MHAISLDRGAVELRLTGFGYQDLKRGVGRQLVELPLDATRVITVELERFTVTTPDTRFVVDGRGGPRDLAAPEVVLLRGRVLGQEQSHAFIALTPGGTGNGYIDLESGERYVLSSARAASASSGERLLSIHRQSRESAMPEFPEFCGTVVSLPGVESAIKRGAAGGTQLSGPRLAHVAVDGDQAYVQLFGTDGTLAALGYVTQVIGALSDIYMRDVGVTLVLSFVRVWPDGGEPFGAHNLNGFRGYWLANEDMTGIDLVHLFSGRRDLPYGGIAYLAGTCTTLEFGISGYMLGSFPSPVVGSHLGNWDLVVVAHELGHNFGTGHTHDSYEPPIDQCASGVHSRGTIMSYCHTTAGGLLNIDMRFHARVQEVIEASVVNGGCLWFDCNGNGTNDPDDILSGLSSDVNANGVPDECEDCNANGVLDSVEIGQTEDDIDGNGIPDSCEADCNANALPDTYEVGQNLLPDENGNLIPDGCEPDCDADGRADHAEIADGTESDVDRNTIPDACQDCNDNGVTDWMDIGRQHNIFVADLGNYVREFHAASGVAIQNHAPGLVAGPYDLVFGADNQLYVACFSSGRIMRVSVDGGWPEVFVSEGSGGLAEPSGLTFAPNGNLFVASYADSAVIEFDATTGAAVRTFVTSGAGGLLRPYGLIFGPNGNLFVTSSDNRVLEYSGANGTYVGAFVATGSGGLDGPRGLVFKPDGNLLVTSFNTDSVIEYDPLGTAIGTFTDDVSPTGAWGIRIGPNGNVFVVRNQGTIRIIEYDVSTGRYIRSFIRGDTGLTSPTGLAFRPASPDDCNGNSSPDSCDIADGTSWDANGDAVPDECETTLVPPAPPAPPHDAPKNRYISLDVSTNNEAIVALRVSVGSMRRCAGDPSRTCRGDADCPWVCGDDSAQVCSSDAECHTGVCVPTSPCIEGPSVGHSGWIGTPYDPSCQNDDGSMTGGPCAGEDVLARIVSAPVLRVWHEQVLHVGDCEIVPVATYEVQATPDGVVFSEPLVVPTIGKPDIRHYGDVAGIGTGDSPPLPGFTPPNGVVNVTDVQAYVLTVQGAPFPSAHTTWVDLHGLSPGSPPNFIINISDLQRIQFGFIGQPYTREPDQLDPADCP